MNVQCKAVTHYRTTSFMINHWCIKHKERTVQTYNRQSLITSLASSVGMSHCDATGAEKISQLIPNIVTGDMLLSSFMEGGGFRKLRCLLSRSTSFLCRKQQLRE